MDPIIQVKNLGKKYNIGERQKYLALRDVLVNLVKTPLGWFNNQAKAKGTNQEFWALQGVNFEVKRGEVLGIIGRNGAGKSTLLKVLSQITPPSVGEVRVRGRVGSLLEVGTGFHPELTGRENIYLNGAILGMRRKEIARKFDEIVDFAGIEKFLDTPVKRYSSGMYVRLAFAVAANLEPEILLIDEVLAVGDVEFQKKCLGKMEDVTKRDGRTVLFVSHNLGAIESLCQRCLLLEDGQVKAIGAPAEVIKGYLEDFSQNQNLISLKDRQDRKGTGQIRFCKVLFKNASGQDVNYFTSGQDAQIWCEYEIIDPAVKSFNFGCSIDTFFNQSRIAFIGNKVVNYKINAQDGLLKMYIKKLPLNVGRYHFSLIFVNETGEIFDWIQKAGEFEVGFGNFYQSGLLPPINDGCLLLDYNFNN